jgi:hypothetical protein
LLLLGTNRRFNEEGMGKIHWHTGALIGLVILSQAASAALDSRVTKLADDRGARLDLDKATIVAQTSVPAPAATAPPQDSKAPPDQSPPAASPAVSTSEVPRPAASGPGCALRFMAAELAGKLKGRKWKQFHQEECGASNALVVFPTAIAPKYTGEQPDKARTLTCADQFTANKTTNGNGGLKWIEKSGGYYSECVVRLKS